MKTIEKLDTIYSVRVDEETSAQIEKLAQYYQRKPSELLRLLLAPILRNEWAKMQREEHPENNQAPTLARFKQ